MDLKSAKKIVDNNNQITLKEDAGVSFLVGFLFFYFFVIPAFSLLWINYIGSIFKFRRPKYNEALTKEIQEITKFPVEIYTVDIPERNAYHAGTKRVFITNGLMDMLTHKEVIAILLHECGHYANSDVKKNVFFVDPICSILILFVIAGLITITVANGVPGDELYFIFKIHDLFSSIKSVILNLTIGRKMEYLADSFASESGYQKEMVSALSKIELFVRTQVCGKTNTKACDIKMKRLHMFDEHPEFWKRKINIESGDLKYTKKAIDDLNFVNAKKSFFELRDVWKKLNIAIKEEKKSKGL